MGIGTTSPSAPLHVNVGNGTTYLGTYGYLNSNGARVNTYNNNVPVAILTPGRIVAAEVDATSDRRAKENIVTVSTAEALKFIDRSRPVHFKWKDQERAYNYGFITQEIDKLGFHELVGIAPDDKMKKTVDDDGYVSPAGGKLSLNYNQVVAILTKGMQAFRSNLADMVQKLTGLDQRLQKAEQENQVIRRENNELKERADKAETETTQTKARLDSLIWIWCEREPNAQICQ